MAAGPSDGFLKSYFSNPFKRKREKGDIELPNQSGRRDPRLPKKSTGEQVKEGFSLFKGLARKK